MSRHLDLGQYSTTALGRYFELVPKDLGQDARRSKRGMTFETKSWEIKDIGHLCVMRMNAFLGLMKMETIVIAPTHADLPLFNVDWVKAFGTETLIAELYDTQLQPWPEEEQKKFEEIKAAYADIEEYSSGVTHDNYLRELYLDKVYGEHDAMEKLSEWAKNIEKS